LSEVIFEHYCMCNIYSSTVESDLYAKRYKNEGNSCKLAIEGDGTRDSTEYRHSGTAHINQN